MLRLPHTLPALVGWCVLWLMLAMLARKLTRTVVAEVRRRRRVEFVRVLETPLERRVPPPPMHGTRPPDPSPRPRSRAS